MLTCMPRAGPCQPTREAATRMSDSAVVTPGCTRSPAGQREDWASLRAWARWVRARCLSVRVDAQHWAAGLVPVVCWWRTHLAMAWSLLWGCLGAWRLLRGACSLEALAGDVAPGRPESRKHTRGGPSFSSAH